MMSPNLFISYYGCSIHKGKEDEPSKDTANDLQQTSTDLDMTYL